MRYRHDKRNFADSGNDPSRYMDVEYERLVYGSDERTVEAFIVSNACPDCGADVQVTVQEDGEGLCGRDV